MVTNRFIKVLLSDYSMKCPRELIFRDQVDTGELLERGLIRALNAVKDQLSELLFEILGDEYQNKPPEFDWSKMKSLEFQTRYQRRDQLIKKLRSMDDPTWITDFDTKVCSIGGSSHDVLVLTYTLVSHFSR